MFYITNNHNNDDNNQTVIKDQVWFRERSRKTCDCFIFSHYVGDTSQLMFCSEIYTDYRFLLFYVVKLDDVNTHLIAIEIFNTPSMLI